jgi:hypothetical protein
MPSASSVFATSKLLVPCLIWLSACARSASGDSSGEATGGSGAAAVGGKEGGSGSPSVVGSGGAMSAAGSMSMGAGASDASFGGSADGDAGGSNGGAAGLNAGGASAGGSNGGAAGVSAGGASATAGGSGVSANFFMRYEAESALNTLTYPVEGVGAEGAPPCAADGVKEGADCASGGKVVNQILGRSPCTPPTSTTSYDQCQDKGGGVQFNDVTVPADGIYDVTWWYHCGQDKPGHADVYGDTKCGGLNYNTGTGSGCRPHLIDVDGVAMSSTVGGEEARYYQFPCYPVSWSILHGATTALPLKAGSNTIYIHAPGATTLDAVDVDAIDVQAEGHGTAPPPLWPKLVTPVVAPN